MNFIFNFSSNLMIILFMIMMILGCGNKSSDISIVPKPLELKLSNSQFEISKSTKVIIDSSDPKVKDVAEYFTTQFKAVSGISLKLTMMENEKEIKNSILISDNVSDRSFGTEGYSFESSKQSVVISGSPHGLFYGIQTLFQLLPSEIYGDRIAENVKWEIPSVQIKDQPRFKWRGMHLDVGRHLFPISFIKKYIDFIAMHKMNTFHWHLTEDQGWRIEIKKYPKLTEIGAWRNGTQIGKKKENDGIRYGGFYTQEQVREIVDYAKERFITVVPEIEMPGHSIAALTSYPHLSCTGGPFEVRKLWGIEDDIYCGGNDSVFTFLENVLEEVLELFPSKYIHIGGDEAPKIRWENCGKCQQRILAEGLEDEHELQSYFIKRIEKYLNSKGRQIIGWDEILEGGLAPNAAVMSWRGIQGGIEAAKQNHYVVMTPTDYCYFDYYQALPENEPLAIGGYLTLEKVYSYEPVPDELTKEEGKYILGVQANQWTEYIATPELAEYMTIPRLSALSEIAWSAKEARDYDDFTHRMSKQYDRFNEMDVNYHWPVIEGLRPNTVFIDSAVLNLNSRIVGSEIRFTLDGTDPTKESELYTRPIQISASQEIMIGEFTSKRKSRVYKAEYIKQTPLDPIIINNEEMGLTYKYYEIKDDIYSVSELFSMQSKYEGVLSKIEFPLPDENLSEIFGLIFNGYIEVPEKNVFTFSVDSNDGSQLYINDKLVVDNDGLHGSYEREGQIALKKGIHKFELLYFQAGGGKKLNVYLKNNKTMMKEELKFL